MKKTMIARASQIGKFMTNDRSGKQMGQTAIKEVQKMVLFDKYGIEDDITSKYLDKGIQNEKQAILMAQEVLGWFDVDPEKPKFRYVNDYITGEPDIDTEMILGDVKCSWDGTTFPWFEKECPNTAYYYQMQAYMWLSDREKAHLVYCLTNMPEQMIMDEVNRAVWRALPNPKYAEKSQMEIEAEMEEHVRSQWIFDHIPLEKRVKRFEIERSEETIEAMKIRIDQVRELYAKLYETI